MWAALTAGLAGQVLARFLLAAGVGFVTYVGFSELLSLALSQVQDIFAAGLTGDLLGLAGWAHLDVPISAWFSGHAAALALSAATRFIPK